MSDEKGNPNNIRDIPSYKKLGEDAKGIDALGKLWPLLRRLRLVKDVFPVSDEALAGLRIRADELLELPDRFNAAFSSRGWIAYESLNLDLMRRAVDLAQASKMDEAELEILSYYRSEEKIRWHLQTMMAVRAWRPRENLASLAMADYLAGRYHAAIPVVLALMDGLVSDLATTGFFAEGTEMTAWNSVAGHSSGLQAVCDIFNKGRRKTTSEEILLPYRHGIMHGRDLGYANEVVAAKTWGTLFAVREWAIKVEEGKSQAPKESEEALTPLAELRESIEKLEKIRREKEALGLWKPREPNSHIGAKQVEEGSPEQRVLEVLTFWRMKNYGGIAGHLSALSGDESIAKRAGRIRQNIDPKQIEGFELLAVADEAPSISVVTAKVKGKASFALEVEDHCFGLRVIYESPEGDVLLRETPGGSWKIIEASLYASGKESELLSNPRAIRIQIES